MTESQWTKKLLSKLRNHLVLKDSAVIVKHSNPYCRGIPDFSVTIGLRTTWWEVKRYGEKPTDIQKYYLKRIGVGANVITISKDGKSATISHVAPAGYLSVEQVVEEIAAMSVPV